MDRWTSSCSANANTNNSVSDGSGRGNGSASGCECECTKRGVNFAFVVKDDPICLEIISKISQCDSVMVLLRRSAVFHSQFTLTSVLSATVEWYSSVSFTELNLNVLVMLMRKVGGEI